MRIVIAIDSFKGSITAAAAADALRRGWVDEYPDDDLVLLPMADGGEGTLDAFATGVAGAQRMPVTVRGPHGRDIDASWLLLPDGTGVVELASTSGIELLADERRGWDADTVGFGQAIAAALDHGVPRLVLGIGSSASTDGGAGMLQALGARMWDAGDTPIRPGLRGMVDLATVDLSALRPLPREGVVALSDVTNPLCGPAGAAAVFGPQKGLTPADIATADAALARYATLLARSASFADRAGSSREGGVRAAHDRLAGYEPAHSAAGEPGAGAAGGTGFGLLAWGARLVPGAAEVAELIGLRAAVAGADLVISGEGSFDGQSAAGKVPAFVAALAADAGVPTALVAGRISADADTAAFAHAVSLTALAGSPAASLAEPARWIAAAGAALASSSEPRHRRH